MRALFFIFSFCFLGCSAFAQASDTIQPQVLEYADQMPGFPGNVNEYLAHNLRYPKKAINKGIQGRVLIRCVINEDGTITDARVVKGIGGGCDEEALRVINSMPKWIPAKQNGKFVKVYFTQPISFRIHD